MATSQAKPLNIITVGGSLAGLMTSIALRRLGHNVRIFERSSTPLLHDQGAGIVAGGDTLEFVTAYDKFHTCPAVHSKQRLYLDKKGAVMQKESSSQHMTSWDLLYYVCRANFDGLQSEYIKHEPEEVEGEGTAAYQHGRMVTGVESMEDKVKVAFKSTLAEHEGEETQHELADFVVVADGPSSHLRKLLSPSSKSRSYAGYVAFRGTVPEQDLSSEAVSTFVEKFPFYHGPGVQILAYAIPGRGGTLEWGSRLINWVWYWNVKDDSDDYKQIMTDKDGKSHRWTLPPGNYMSKDVWERQKQRASEMLPPQFAELVGKTESPFVQAITDVEPLAEGKVWYLDGKVVVVGDAVAQFRPHTAAATTQAAFHALRLPDVFIGQRSKEDYQTLAMRFARSWQERGVMLGNRSQFGHHPLEG